MADGAWCGRPRGWLPRARGQRGRALLGIGLAALLVASVARADGQPPTIAWDASRLSTATYRRIDALNLERRAVLRLMEEGFAVVHSTTPATVVIRLEEDGPRLAVAVRGPGGQHRRPVTHEGARTAELHLEIIQRAVVLARMVLEVPAKPLKETAPERLAATSRPAGGRAAAAAAPSASARPPAAAVSPASARPPAAAVSSPSARPPAAPSAAAARLSSAPPPPPPRSQPPAVAVAPPPAPAAPPRAAARWLTFGAWLGAGALVRGGGTDVMPHAGVRVGLGRRLGVHLQAAVAPSASHGVEAQDWQIAGGVGYRWDSRWRTYVEAAALLGVLVHHYGFSETTALGPAGVRSDVCGALSATVGVALWSGFALELRVAPGLTRERAHVVADTTLWRRGGPSLEVGGALSWRAW